MYFIRNLFYALLLNWKFDKCPSKSLWVKEIMLFYLKRKKI